MLGNGDGEGGEDASYFVKRSSNKVFGPFDKKTIRLMLRANKIAPEAEVSVDKEEWTPLSSIDAFADMISEASDGHKGAAHDSDAQTDVGGGGFNMPSNEPGRDPDDDTIPVDSPDFDASFASGEDAQEAELPRSAQSDDGAAPSSDDLELPTPKGGTKDEDGEDAPSNLPGLPTSQEDEETALPQSKSTVDGDEDIDLPASKDEPLAPDPKSGDSDARDPLAPVSSDDDSADDDQQDDAPPLFDDLDDEDDDGWKLPTSKPTTEEEDPDKTRIDRPEPDLPASKGESNLPASGESELPQSTSSDESAQQVGGTQTDPDAETGDVDLPTSSEPELPASGPPDLPTSGEPELPTDQAHDAPESKEAFDKGDADVDFSKVDELEEPQREGTPGEGFSDPDLDLTPSAEEYEETTGRSLEEETGKADSSSRTEGSGMFAEDDSDLFGDGDDDLFGPADDDVFEDDEPLFDERSDDADITSAEKPQGRPEQPSAKDSRQDQQDDGDFGEQDLAGDEVEYQGGSGLLELDTPETRSREADQGIEPDRTQPAEQPEAPAQPAQEPDDGGGSGVLVPMLALTGLIAAIGAGGWYVYDAFLSDPDVPSASEESTETTPTKPSRASVDPGVATTDVWGDIHPAIERARSGSLEGADRGELLLLEALLLSRYDAPQIQKHAASLAKELTGDSGAWTKLALGAWEARNGRPDAAQSHLNAADVDGTDAPELATYFRDLSLGIAHIKALGETNDGSSGSDSTKGGEENGSETDASEQEEGTAPVQETTATEAEHDHIAAADEALASARAAADDRAAPLFWKARGRERARQDEEALTLYQDAIERQPNHVASRLGAARLLYARGDLKGVSKHAEKILSELGAPAAPAETAEAYHLIGLVHEARSEYTAAIESFTKSINQGEYRPETLEALASAYESAGQYQEALNFFKSNKLGEENPAVILGLVRSHIGLENWQEAINALERGEKLFPNDARFPFYLGQLNRERGAFSDARRAMRRAVQIDPGLMEAYGILAQLAWRLEEDVNEAEGYVSRVVEQPDALTADAAREVAEYYRMRGERALAAQWYQAALDRNPNAWRAKLALAELRLKSRETDAALELLEGARESGVENKQLSLHLADAYRQAGQYDRALKEINNVVGKQSENPRHLFTRGMIHFDRGNYETARRDFNKAYELAPRFHRAYFYVGRCAFERGDSKNAMKIFRHVLDYKPKNGEFRYWMGRAFEDQGRLEEALSEYEKAITFDETYVTEHPRVLVESGRLKVKLNQPSTGIKQIRRALEIAPEFRPALLALGEAYFATEQYGDSIDALRRALKDDPDAAQAQRTLGMAYIYTERRRQGAQHLQKAVKFGYDDPDIYKTLGYVYKELGEDQLAVDAFKSFLRESKDQQLPETTRREMLRQIQQLGG
jgi:tetratricopeptide (TPR) repeat protein